MKDNLLLKLSKEFAIDVINLCNSASCGKKSDKLLDQLLRSGTSIGANIYEGNYASSKADFINKFQIALKECYETEYWLELFVKAKIIDEIKVKKLLHDCGELRRMLVSSVATLKNG